MIIASSRKMALRSPRTFFGFGGGARYQKTAYNAFPVLSRNSGDISQSHGGGGEQSEESDTA